MILQGFGKGRDTKQPREFTASLQFLIPTVPLLDGVERKAPVQDFLEDLPGLGRRFREGLPNVGQILGHEDLGPRQFLGVVAATDGVQVCQPTARQWWELRTTWVATAQGYRYLSGLGETFLQRLYLLILLCGGLTALVTLLGDGARWIRDFFAAWLVHLPRKELILDWYHLKHKGYALLSMIARGRKEKAWLLGQLVFYLWRGDVEAAVARLEAYRPQAKNLEKLEELIEYLRSRQTIIPNDKARRAQRQFNSSAPVEKANDLLVARRQKHQGMHWSEATSDALAALKTLMLNHGWDLYWQKRQVLPLAVPT